jgi:hypothetical protein
MVTASESNISSSTSPNASSGGGKRETTKTPISPVEVTYATPEEDIRMRKLLDNHTLPPRPLAMPRVS